MPKRIADKWNFGRIKRRWITANFAGGALSSDDGLMLLRQMDRKIGLSAAAAAVVHDPRHPDLVTHSLRSLIAQRLNALACGYEDLNYPAQLRTDPFMQTATSPHFSSRAI